MDEELQNLEQLLDELLQGIESVLASGEELTDEFQGLLAQELEYTTNRIDELKQNNQSIQQPFQGQPQQTLNPTPPSSDAQLLWILAGQNEDAFVNYLKTYPTAATQNLLNNPSELNSTLEFLHAMMPPGEQPVADGIPHADLNSSNIYGFRYSPQSQKLKVRFQGGSVYEYDGVPVNIFNAFSQGASSAKTDGQNQYGKWWKGKNPSLGAAFWDYIRNSGFDYKKLR